MKRIILLNLFAILAITANAQEKNKNDEKPADNFYKNETKLYTNTRYMYHEEVKNDMTYGIWSLRAGYYETGYTIFVVNLTKEALEVELLKLQIVEQSNKNREEAEKAIKAEEKKLK